MCSPYSRITRLCKRFRGAHLMRPAWLTVRSAVTVTALTLGAATAIAACGNSTAGSTSLGISGAYGSVPAMATGTEHSGAVTVGAPPGTAANWVLPLITGADNSVFTVLDFDYQLYRPLYWSTNGVKPEVVPSMSLANAPVWSNGDKTATFVLNFKAAVNPSWAELDQIGAIQPMPSAKWTAAAEAANGGKTLNPANPADAKTIYNFLSAQSQKLSTYATNPLWQTVDGPYHLTAFDSSNSAFTMAPNPNYGGPESKAPPTLKVEPFTSDAAEVNAVKAGSITVGYLPLTDLPTINTVKNSASGYNAFGYDSFGWNYVAYNFKDTSGDFDKIIGQLYIRQALAHLEDEAGYIKAFLNGGGGQAYGPVPLTPTSAYTPSDALTDPYPFSLSDATTLLKDHGWTVNPGGVDTCAKPGTAANECGAGIPPGTKLAWTLAYGTSPASIGQEDTALASEAAKAGIQITLKSSSFDFLVQNYNNPAAPKEENAWAMSDFGGFTDSTYPTTFGVFNSTGSSNLGSYDDPKADALIQASISSSNPQAVKAEASYLTEQQPGLFQPNPDAGGNGSSVMVWSKSLSGPPTSFESLTQFDLNPEFWFFTK